jgi:Protein of unknown function (DUF1592)/Protein of unknown function (DUF1588)/Protein of unknown function (DUF1595)/Protein of unknown function (DUF1585)
VGEQPAGAHESKEFSMKFGVRSLVLMLGTAVGCSGSSTGTTPGDGVGGDGGGNTGGGGDVIAPPGACELPKAALPPTRTWRLSSLQYANTLKQDFGFVADVSGLPVDAAEGESYAAYASNSDGRGVGSDHFGTFQSNAAALVARLAPEAERDHACLLNQPDGACVDSFVDAFASRAFRRPIADDERTLYADYFRASAKAYDAKDAIRMVLTVMLQSPRHLYRSELGSGDGEVVSLSHHEIAAQLSYMLADTSPDAELLKAANDGLLRDPDVVRSHAERLLRLPGARAKIGSFFAGWLKTENLANGSVSKDAAKYPAFTNELRNAMAKETETFVDKVLFEEGGNLRDLFAADHTYVNRAVSEVYGLKSQSATFDRIALPKERKGILSHPSFLAATSPSDHSSPATRGINLYSRLFCQPIPNPPPGAADQAQGKIFSTEPNLTQREHWEFAQKAAPQCAACHGQFVPMGLGLEQFDAIGRYRPEEFGKTIDTTVQMGDFDALGGTYDNAMEMGVAAIESEVGRACFATQMQTFASGRRVDTEQEACELKDLATRLKDSDYDVSALIVSLTQVSTFYNRRQGE